MESPVRFRIPAQLPNGGPGVRCATIRLVVGPTVHDQEQRHFCVPMTDDEAADHRALREGLAKHLSESIINDEWEN